MGDQFEFFENLAGRHKHNGERVVYDLVARARQPLLENGFDDGYFVVEVKLFNESDKKAHDVKARDLLWQCVTYAFSEITLPSGETKCPLFVLYYIGGTGVKAEYGREVTELHHFVQRGGVGRLELGASNWSMSFGGSRYFSRARGKGPHNVGTKRQVGSSR